MTAAMPLRILQVVAPARYGGLESVVDRLAGGLAERGHRVQLAASLSPGDARPPLLDALAGRGVAVTELRVGRRAYRAEARQLAALCTAGAAQLVHTHGPRSDWLGGVLARRLGLPCFATVHGFIRHGWRSRASEWLHLRSLRRIDGVIAVSTPLAEALRAAGVPAERVHRIPNAWAPRAPRLSRAEARRVLGLPEGAAVAGFVGRLGREKGPDLAVEALGRLGAAAPHLCLLGDGPDAAALRVRAERRGVAARIHQPGAREAAERLFPAFDLFVLSSRSEGTPIALFEAMAAGVPIVAARVGGVPQVVGEAEALLVAPGDPDALAAAIRASLSDPAAAAARAERARAKLAAQFAPGPWLERHEALYRAALAGSGSSASAASPSVAGTTSAKRETPST